MTEWISTGTKGTGSRGEAIAASYLLGRKYRILERNFRCKGGEVDIIAMDGATLVFVEVKARRSLSFGSPQSAVTPFKQRQLSKAALTWLLTNKKTSSPARFDVIAVLLQDRHLPQIEHIQNAFDLAY